MENIEDIYAKVIETAGGLSFDQNLPNHIGIQFIDLADRKHPSALDIEKIRVRVKEIPGARITVDEQKECHQPALLSTLKFQEMISGY